MFLTKVSQLDFMRAGFLRVIGAMDCTHIPIPNPGENGELFCNRKGSCSINVQVVCDDQVGIPESRL